LYQLGDFSSESKLLWRTDITDGDWLPLLEKEVAFALERLSNTTRETNSLHSVGEIASYISQWLPHDSKCSARRASEIAQNFGNDLSPLIEEMKINTVSEDNNDITVNSDHLAQLCAKQAIYYLIALCCYADVEFSSEDITKICELRVQANKVHAIVMRIDRKDLRTLMDTKAKLSAIVENMMTLRVDNIVSLIGYVGNFSCLTNSLKHCVDDLPDHLNWTALHNSSYCYEARHLSTVYNINVVSGSVLINGSPPNLLPASILQHPMYLRTFESHNFEVSFCVEGFYRTTRCIMGKIYKFTPPSTTKQLIIKEFDPAAKMELELLDGTKDSTWQGDMPIRLCDSYSHWLYKERDILLLRPINFWDRRIEYFAQHWGFSKWDFFEVPLHHQVDKVSLSKLEDMLESSKKYRRLVLLKDMPDNTRILDIFGKFDSIDYAEFYLLDGSLTVSLPRFQLSFELVRFKKRKLTDKGSFQSNEFSDFFLCNSQQLEDCFDNFRSYLLLKKGQF